MSAEIEMTMKRFADIVAAYGAEPRAWPENEREAAVTFRAQHLEAQRLADEAEAIDGLLASGTTPAPDRALEERIMSSFQATRRRHAPAAQRWAGAGAIAASLVLGITAAWIAFRPHDGVDLSDPAAWEVLGDDLEFGAKDAR